MENLILCAVTLSNIYNKAFLKNRKRSLAVNYFHKKSSFINVLQGAKHTSESNRKTSLNPWSASLTKGSNTFKQIVGSFPKNCLSVFDHFVGLALKGLTQFVPMLPLFQYVQVLYSIWCRIMENLLRNNFTRDLSPISCHWSLSIPAENLKKTIGFPDVFRKYKKNK